MSIALVSPFAMTAASGVSQHVLGLSAELQRVGHEVVVIAPAPAKGTPALPGVRPIGKALPLHTNGAVAHLMLDPTRAGEVRRLLVDHRIELVHLQDPLTPLLPFLGFEAARRLDIPVVGTFHAYRDHRPWWTTPALPYVRRLVGGLAGRIAVSPPARDYAMTYLHADFEVIPNGIDTRWYHDPGARVPWPEAATDRILFVGRFEEPRKGLEILLRAMPRVWERRPGAHVTVVGPGNPGHIVSAQHDPVWRQVRFAGFVPDDQLPAHVRSSDLLCAPATGGESFGLVLAQAMAAGTPVVASRIPGYASVITHDHDGCLVPAGDPKALGLAIAELLADPHRRRRYALAGVATAAGFAWPDVARRVVAVYERAMG